ncbi:sulfotransferase domain-containing protein [Halioglobus maricola]|uniref:Sulfotransferase domain-containing protein n=1 Tax=Halioglobus maricola TaxID=2601894 RepID=A0A5P9NKY5_9GAMM|nr:sulfotransferase domain-containing protein [Halioglobus maricola]QFU75894.1 sulfotransferase domain-containing protein [Halioglobus maricola]
MGNIVWMASYPKSGNTWVRAFLHNYIADSETPSDINNLGDFFANESNASWYKPLVDNDLQQLDRKTICQLRAKVQQNIAASRRGTIMVKTHNFLGAYEDVPLHDMSITSGAISVVRNPLDVVLSLADHFGLDTDQAIEFMGSDNTGTPTDDNNVASVLASWSTHVESWTRDQSGATCVLRYEDLLDEPHTHFAKLTQFLGLPDDPKRLDRAIEHSSFSKLKNFEEQSGFVERSPNSSRFFRAGRKNQWSETLEPTQVQRLVDDHREIMSRFDYIPPANR